jgi:hypothetical protein
MLVDVEKMTKDGEQAQLSGVWSPPGETKQLDIEDNFSPCFQNSLT